MNYPLHLILSPGTRVVTRNDVDRIGGGQFIAAGAVAVITFSPADAQHAYKVRSNDGCEAMLRRTEFSILKEFKADEAVGRDSAPASSGFAFWNRFIIYRCVVGAQSYGLSGANSDIDRGGIHLPSDDLHWSLSGVPEQIVRNFGGLLRPSQIFTGFRQGCKRAAWAMNSFLPPSHPSRSWRSSRLNRTRPPHETESRLTSFL